MQVGCSLGDCNTSNIRHAHDDPPQRGNPGSL